MQLAIFCKYTFVCTVLTDLATKPILLKNDMHVRYTMMQVWYNPYKKRDYFWPKKYSSLHEKFT